MKLFLTLALGLFLSARAGAGTALADFWNGRATWVRDGQNIGRNFNFHFISIVSDGREIHAYFIRSHPSANGKFKLGVGRARSNDGLNWIDEGPVLDVSAETAWDDRISSFPGIWKDHGTYYLVYEGASENIPFSPGAIGLATAQDGYNFVKYTNNPLLRANAGGWERVNIGTPSLYRENGVWYLFYHGFDGNVCQIGVASGPDLFHLAKSPANPILPVSPDPAAWDTGTTGHRSRIVKEGPYYYLAFEGSTAQPYDRAKWSSGLARSTNLLSGWVKFPGNPMLPQISGMSNDGPELFQLKNVWYLYVRTTSPTVNMTTRYRLAGKTAGQR